MVKLTFSMFAKRIFHRSLCLISTMLSPRTLRASERGDLYSYIVVPAGVHGLGSGPVGRVSGLLKFVSAAFIEAGSGFYVGEGSNVMGYVSCRA